MPKVNLVPITGAQNLTAINDNFNKVMVALDEQVLFRDNVVGEPNQMENDLDMNGNRIYNLPDPIEDGEPVSLGYLNEVTGLDNLGNVLRVPEPIIELPAAAVRANKYVKFNSVGQPELAEGDETLRSELAAPNGYQLVGGFSTPTDNLANALAGPNGFLLVGGVNNASDELAAALAGPNGSNLIGGNVRQLASISALRALSGETSNAVIVTDTVTGGVFTRGAAGLVDNGGTVVVDASGVRWVRQYDGAVNVRWFGATGNGSTNDSPAFQSALNALNGMSQASVELMVPAGTYILSAGLALSTTKHIKISGVGFPHLICTDRSNNTGINITSTRTVSLKDFRLEAYPANTGLVKRGIRVQGGENHAINLEGVEVYRNASVGATSIVGFDLVNPALSRVVNCRFNGFPGVAYPALGSGGIAFQMTASNIISTDSIFDTCVALGVEIAFRIESPQGGAGGAYLEGITWKSCTVVGAQIGVFADGAAITGYRSVLYRWIGGHINAQQFCLIFRNLNQIHISDAVLYMDRNPNAQSFIMFDNCTDANVHGNTLCSVEQTGNGSTNSGVGVAFSNGGTIGTARNNTIDGITAPNFSIWGQPSSNRVIASGNIMRGAGLSLQGPDSVDHGDNIVF